MTNRSHASMLSTQLVAPFILRSKTFVDDPPLVHAKKAVSRITNIKELDSMIKIVKEQKMKVAKQRYPIGSWVWVWGNHRNLRPRVTLVRRVITHNNKSFRLGDVNERGCAIDAGTIIRPVTDEEVTDCIKTITPLLGKYNEWSWTDMHGHLHTERTTFIRFVYTDNKTIYDNQDDIPDANGEVHVGIVYTEQLYKNGQPSSPIRHFVAHVLNLYLADWSDSRFRL